MVKGLEPATAFEMGIYPVSRFWKVILPIKIILIFAIRAKQSIRSVGFLQSRVHAFMSH